MLQIKRLKPISFPSSVFSSVRSFDISLHRFERFLFIECYTFNKLIFV